ncbi:serine hydrolase domain-containing protein [Paraglaciecola chathamensis]|jgi:CubicO group peptidase (beta-lactamase class C family)|uniref:Serine hydrolase n=2 Tax=Paraglaciecola chathamensis TaxID=368405 RepID=A0A8H9I9K7_9ALTE|nr:MULTISPECIES: serine hydrolase domain-containing protein [Paraglaciecola]GAC03103.1 beta-lactamase [Paraglaciecola agarilytica NO2]GGZ48686.1 serine hydrolase [Paraglaciecola oceanifecundans]
MNKTNQLLLACAASALLAQSALADIRTTNPKKVGMSKARLERIEPAMQAFVDEQKLAGTLTLVARKGKVVHVEGVGYRDREAKAPMSEDTIFRIYSMTKPITAVAALTLWEQGKFQMNDPVSKYLPELANLKVYAGMDGENMVLEDTSKVMTIKQLFTHTAGFSYGFTQSPVDKLYQQSALFSGQIKRQDLLKEVAKLPLNHQPGSKWNYSIGTDIIGILVERLSGQTLGAYFEQHIFEPLEMDDTGFYVPEDKQDRLAQIYVINQQGQTVPMENEPLGDYLSAPEIESGGGGLVSTIEDYYTFTQMLLNGGEYQGKRILGRKTVEYMRTNHLPTSLIPFEPSSTGEGYGLAMSVTVDEQGANTMGSAGDYGWAGAASTYFRIDPKEQMIVISMTQLMPSSYFSYNKDFKNIAYQALID